MTVADWWRPWAARGVAGPRAMLRLWSAPFMDPFTIHHINTMVVCPINILYLAGEIQGETPGGGDRVEIHEWQEFCGYVKRH